MSENQSLFDKAITHAVGLVRGTIKQDENVLVSLALSSLSQKLDEVATACAFAAAYSPREILDVLESRESRPKRNLLLTILRDRDSALESNPVTIDPMVKYAVEQAEITRDGAIKNNRTFFWAFKPILTIAAEIDDRIRQLESPNSSDMETLLSIIVKSSCRDPEDPKTIELHHVDHAVALFARHPQSGRLIGSLGQDGLESLIAEINKAMVGSGSDSDLFSNQIREAFENLADMSRS